MQTRLEATHTADLPTHSPRPHIDTHGPHVWVTFPRPVTVAAAGGSGMAVAVSSSAASPATRLRAGMANTTWDGSPHQAVCGGGRLGEVSVTTRYRGAIVCRAILRCGGDKLGGGRMDLRCMISLIGYQGCRRYFPVIFNAATSR